jgi:tRNA modification GTPase
LDLAQAEAVADLIAANTKAAQQTALAQLRGGFSNELKDLREQLINFTALIELELDFSQEDVTFADRQQFRHLISNIKTKILGLIQSFQLGNAIKNGISVAIIGKPNAGKSTLLNALLNEERAIVSEIPGTTRDTIEETLNINEILFRLIDTAGIREHAKDAIENIGMERSRLNAEKANLILHLIDATNNEAHEIDWLNKFKEKTITVYNKSDLLSPSANDADAIIISAKEKKGIDVLKQRMYEKALGGTVQTESTIVTNIRHQTALIKVAESLEEIQAGIENNISTDLLASDIRRALHYLGEITGQVEIDRDILGTIFGRFCIGK